MAGQGGAAQDGPMSNPVLKAVRGLLITLLSTYILGLVVWMIASSYADPWRIRAVKEREFEAADRIVWLFGYRDGWAADLAYEFTEDLLKGAPRLGDPAPVIAREKASGTTAAFTQSLRDVKESFISQHAVRMQGEYIPLIVVRHLLVLACVIPSLCLMMMAWKVGEYLATERMNKGLAMRNHWMSTWSTLTGLFVTLLATYPFMPLTAPSIIIIPVITAMLVISVGAMRSHMYAFK